MANLLLFYVTLLCMLDFISFVKEQSHILLDNAETKNVRKSLQVKALDLQFLLQIWLS